MEMFDPILYALPVYQSAILALLLFASGKRKGLHSRLLMGAFLSAACLFFTFNLLYNLLAFDLLVYFYIVILPVILVLIPLFYLYLEAITTPGFHTRKNKLVHFLPSVIFLILQTPFVFITRGEKQDYISHGYSHAPDSPVLKYVYIVYVIGIYLVCNLQIAYYMYQSLKLFNRHRSYISNRYSYTDNISLGWIRALIVCFIAFYLVNELFIIFGIRQQFITRLFYNVSMLTVSLFAGVHAMMQKDLGTEEDNGAGMQAMQIMQEGGGHGEEVGADEPLKSKYSGSSLSAEQKDSLVIMLEKLMREEKIYTLNDLSLDQVALRLETNSKYISQILNEHHGKNFFTFINTYRVEEAQRLLTAENARKYSITGISRMAGFSSKSSFNEAFRRIAGMTPSEYQEKAETR